MPELPPTNPPTSGSGSSPDPNQPSRSDAGGDPSPHDAPTSGAMVPVSGAPASGYSRTEMDEFVLRMATHDRLGEQSGDSVGPYRLLERIGEGGFGEVWLAEQRGALSRRVAIKLIKLGMDTRAVVARFEQERQALALLDHPNIAKVFDAGATETGRPYFVMEFIKGEPVATYCDRQRLTMDERLALFAQICDAVHHAHMKGIIHRDLKPGNILVSIDQSQTPRPVIIDFGVAKAVASRLTEKTIFTERGQLIGTPEYMSPEQAEMGETDIDTRTDIYSLGVILYELLTGAGPFDSRTLREAGYAGIQRMIREVDPPRPSTKLSSLGASASKVAEARRLKLEQLASTLRGELEWIPLKAMRKERAERYRSAAELADDVRNYLADRPLIAGPESTWYRARKFVRKHRAPVAGVSLAMAAIIAAGAVAAWKWRDEAAARREAEARQRALTTLVAFISQDLLAPPDDVDGPYLRVPQERLDAAAKDLGERFKDMPEIEAQLGATLGRAYLGIGSPKQAAQTLERTRALIAADASRAPELAGQTAIDLSEAYMRLRDGKAAIAAIRAAVAEREKRVGPGAATDAELGTMLNMLGNALKWAGEHDEAYSVYERALAVRRAALKPGHPDLFSTRINLLHNRTARLKADIAAARKAGDEALADKRGAEREELVREYTALADEAAAALGPAHIQTIAARTEAAGLLFGLGRYEESARAFQPCVDALRAREKTRHWRTIETMARYGNALLRAGDAAGARAVLAEALQGYRDPAVYGPAHESTATVAGWLAAAAEKAGDVAGAAAVLERQYADLAAAGEPSRAKAIAKSLSDLFRRSGDAEASRRWATLAGAAAGGAESPGRSERP